MVLKIRLERGRGYVFGSEISRYLSWEKNLCFAQQLKMREFVCELTYHMCQPKKWTRFGLRLGIEYDMFVWTTIKNHIQFQSSSICVIFNETFRSHSMNRLTLASRDIATLGSIEPYVERPPRVISKSVRFIHTDTEIDFSSNGTATVFTCIDFCIDNVK